MESQNKKSFDEVKLRLDEIVETVNCEDISLHDALSLYEEAVKLGMRATTLIEEDINQGRIDELVAAYEKDDPKFIDISDESSLDVLTTEQDREIEVKSYE